MDIEKVRSYIEAQICPWCERGPWKVLASHTWRGHAVSAAELRVMADRRPGESICSPASSELFRERLEERPDRQEIAKRGGARATEAKAQAVAGAATRAKFAKHNAEKYKKIELLYRANPTMTLLEIGEAVGMHYRTVKVALRRAGINLGDHRAVTSGTRPVVRRTPRQTVEETGR